MEIQVICFSGMTRCLYIGTGLFPPLFKNVSNHEELAINYDLVNQIVPFCQTQEKI